MNAYTTPESVRTAKSETIDALAFQIALASVEAWPTEVALTAFDAKLIEHNAYDTALTVHLNNLARW